MILYSLILAEEQVLRLGGAFTICQSFNGAVQFVQFAQTQQAQSLGRHVVTIPSLRAPRRG